MEGRLTELLLLLEEGAVQGMGDGVIQKFEAVKDLDGAAPLNADDAAKNPRGGGRWGRGGGGGITAVGGVSGRNLSGLGLGLDPSVVIGYVEYDQGVELEG